MAGGPGAVDEHATAGDRRERTMGKGWVQAALLVGIFGFTVLGYMAARTYQAEPPIPDRVVSQSGTELFSGENVRSGQEVFLKNGLMQFGSLFGHGAYLGPDFTADFRTNTYDPSTGTLVSDAQAGAYNRLIQHYHDFFLNPGR